MKAFGILQIDTIDIKPEEWHKLMKTMYFNMVAKVKLPKRLLHLDKQAHYSKKFMRQVKTALPLDYTTMTHQLTVEQFNAFIGVVMRTASPATAFHLKSLIKRERRLKYHLTSQQIKLIIDETLFNQSVIDGLKLVLSEKKAKSN